MMYSHNTETAFNAFSKAFESVLANYGIQGIPYVISWKTLSCLIEYGGPGI